MKIFNIVFVLLFSIPLLYSQDFTTKNFNDYYIDQFVVKDFDKDGDLDIFGIDFPFSPDATIYLFLNDNPFFTAVKKDILYSNYTCSGKPYSFDIDNDGDFDVILAKGDSLNIVAFINDGKAKFTEKRLNINGSDNFNVIDIDNDGDLDIMGVNRQSKKINAYINDGTNNYMTKQISVSTLNETIESFQAADIDGDGDGDFCIGYLSYFDEQIVLLINKDQVKFDTIIISKGNFKALNKIDLIDLNKDSKPDIIATNRDDGLVAWINKGNNKFEQVKLAAYPGSSGFGFTEFAFGDFNSDSNIDIIVADFGNGTYRLSQTSKSPLRFDIIKGPGQTPANVIVAGDMDGDKDVDLLISNGDFWYAENNIKQLTDISDFQINDNIVYSKIGNKIILQNVIDQTISYRVSNIFGETIIEGASNGHEFEIPNVPFGIYFISIRSANKNGVIKLILD